MHYATVAPMWQLLDPWADIWEKVVNLESGCDHDDDDYRDTLDIID